jgi:hypothetical protein
MDVIKRVGSVVNKAFANVEFFENCCDVIKESAVQSLYVFAMYKNFWKVCEMCSVDKIVSASFDGKFVVVRSCEFCGREIKLGSFYGE